MDSHRAQNLVEYRIWLLLWLDLVSKVWLSYPGHACKRLGLSCPSRPCGPANPVNPTHRALLSRAGPERGHELSSEGESPRPAWHGLGRWCLLGGKFLHSHIHSLRTLEHLLCQAVLSAQFMLSMLVGAPNSPSMWF